MLVERSPRFMRKVDTYRGGKHSKPERLVSSFNISSYTSPILGQDNNMTVSKRVAEKKVAKFEKNVGRRGVGPLSSKSNNPFEPAHIVLILFAVLVVASFIFQVVRMAMDVGADS